MRCLSANMHRGPQTIPSDWGSCKKVEYKEAADFFSSQANSACYPGGIHISGLVQRKKGTIPSHARRVPSGLQFTAQQSHDGDANLFINVLVLWKGKSNHDGFVVDKDGEALAVQTTG
jgi:hypothetical protein